MRAFRIAPLAWSVLLGVSSSAQESTANDSIALRSVDRYVIAKMRSAKIPGLAVGIVKGDRVVYLKAFGIADPTGRAVTPQTPFIIGSITKSFTALAVMQLAEAGRIDLDAPVQRYLPWFRLADATASAEITVRQLMTMTSGIPQDYEVQDWTDQDDEALERAVRVLKTVEPTGPPGRTFGYSNSNYETLGMIVQVVSGMSYEEYLKQRIFAPLAMRNSFVSQDEAIRHGMASGYRWWFGIPVAVTLPYNRAELPAGYIIASAEDMTHFVSAELNGGRFAGASVLSPRWMALRHVAPRLHDYGLGWEFARVNGRELINHDGGTANFQSSLFIDPQAHVGVYIAANIISALDAFSSPSSSSPFDGATTRGMAARVLSMVTNQPLPKQGPGHERLTVVFNLLIAVLTAALAVSLARVPMRLRCWAGEPVVSGSELAPRVGIILLLNSALAIALTYLWLYVPVWRALRKFEPDLGYWLMGVAVLLLVKGAVEASFLARLFRATRIRVHSAPHRSQEAV
jgi:CubicO group peptidase (beta-lactamase class C family)